MKMWQSSSSLPNLVTRSSILSPKFTSNFSKLSDLRKPVSRSMQGGVGIPALRWSGAEGDYNVLVRLSLLIMYCISVHLGFGAFGSLTGRLVQLLQSKILVENGPAAGRSNDFTN